MHEGRSPDLFVESCEMHEGRSPDLFVESCEMHEGRSPDVLVENAFTQHPEPRSGDVFSKHELNFH